MNQALLEPSVIFRRPLWGGGAGGKQGHENIEEPVGPERHLAPASTIIEATHG